MDTAQRAAIRRAELAVQAIEAQTPQETKIAQALDAIVKALKAIAEDQPAAHQLTAGSLTVPLTVPMPQTRLEPGPGGPKTTRQ
jgi:hypothetical protein